MSENGGFEGKCGSSEVLKRFCESEVSTGFGNEDYIGNKRARACLNIKNKERKIQK